MPDRDTASPDEDRTPRWITDPTDDWYQNWYDGEQLTGQWKVRPHDLLCVPQWVAWVVAAILALKTLIGLWINPGIGGVLMFTTAIAVGWAAWIGWEAAPPKTSPASSENPEKT